MTPFNYTIGHTVRLKCNDDWPIAPSVKSSNPMGTADILFVNVDVQPIGSKLTYNIFAVLKSVFLQAVKQNVISVAPCLQIN